tara:strand:- start:258 stop:536 length:279 start_codon:yes stop_codon:yes gene_type:complete
MTKKITADFGNEAPITIRVSRDQHRLISAYMEGHTERMNRECALQRMIQDWAASILPEELEDYMDRVSELRAENAERLEAEAIAIRTGGLSL